MDRDAYNEYLQSDQWASMRLVSLGRAGYRCQVCNSPDELQVHHRTYERLGNEQPEDLTVLCDDCHSMFSERAKKPASFATIGESLSAFYQEWDGKPHAIPTAFLDLDSLLGGGLQGSELVAVAARPSVGKTSFVLNIARSVAVDAKLPVGIITLESDRNDLCQRLLAMQASVDSFRLRSGRASREDVEHMLAAGDLLSEAKFYISNAPRQNILGVLATARKMKSEHGVELLLIDSIDLIESQGRRQEQISHISRRLKILAREFGIPVVVTAMVDRNAADREDHRPRLADLRERGPIEQHADTIMLLNRPELYEPGQHEGIVEVIVGKQRNGPTGEVTLTWDRRCGRFSNFALEPSS